MLDFSEISGVPAGQSGSSEQRDSDGFITLRRKNPDSPNAPISEHRDADGFISLKKRAPDDPMQLESEVMEELRLSLNKSKAPLVEGQYEMLESINRAVLDGKKNTVTAVPLHPGGGKSTYIRCLLRVLSRHFAAWDSVAERLGGVVVVVETSLEGHELESLCKAEGCQVAKLVESVNDSNLRHGGCPIGLAASYAECLRRQCPHYRECPLIFNGEHLHQTPVIIVLHARYAQYIEDASELSIWHTADGEEHVRTLLLIDELPDLFSTSCVSLQSIGEAEADLDALKRSYLHAEDTEKKDILYDFQKLVRTPFFKLWNSVKQGSPPYGIFDKSVLEQVGDADDKLHAYQKRLRAYGTHTKAEQLVGGLLAAQHYYMKEQSFSIVSPRLKAMDTSSGFATFIFSGTATLSPEITQSDYIQLMDSCLRESYHRLMIKNQRGDGLSAARRSISNPKNYAAVLEWLKMRLEAERPFHKRILVVTYMDVSERLWHDIAEFHDCVLPYIDREGIPSARLPYFGGLNGSNQYQKASCVICVGLNRFTPGDYLSRTLALNPSDDSIAEALRSGLKSAVKAESVLEIQDITLARDIVQLVFRSALRLHGQDTPITLWLFQPPNGMVGHLQEFFGDCQIQEIPNLPESCHTAATTNHQYAGKRTHAGLLLEYLTTTNASQITPADIRSATGLTMTQFKEGMKSRTVKNYMAQHFLTSGSGKNTVYYKCAA